MAMPACVEQQPSNIMHKKARLPKVNVTELLKEVSRRPALWQPHHADFNNRFTRAELWRDVAVHLVPNFHDAKDKVKLVASIASRWKSQRTTMLRCMRNKQPFLHEKEMSFMVPILQARVDVLKAKHPKHPAATADLPKLRQRKDTIIDFGTKKYRKNASLSNQPTVPPIRIINRNHTTVGWQRLPVAPTSTSANNRSLPSTSTAPKPATILPTGPPKRSATTVVTVHTATNASTAKKRSANLQEDIQRKLPCETTIKLCRPQAPYRMISAATTSTTTETPACADSSAAATATSGATSTTSNPIRYPSPVPGEPTVAQELIPPDESMELSEEDANQSSPVDGVITKEEVIDIGSDMSDDLDMKILSELPFLNCRSGEKATPPQTVVHAYRGNGECNAEQPSSSPRSAVCVEIPESNDAPPPMDSGCPSGSEQAAAPLRAATRMDSGCPSSSSQEVDLAERRCSDAGTLPLNSAQSRSNSTNPLPGGGLVITDFRGSSPMSHPNATSHNASLDTTMAAHSDPDQAFFDSIKPHMRHWSSDKKLDFQFEVLGLLRNFRSKQ